MTRETSNHLRMLIAAPLLGATLLLGGCGGVQFEGKVFEAVGLAGEPQKQEKKVADRAPLILPPKRELPPPGPEQRVAKPESWPNDPDAILKERQVAAKQKKTRCGDADFKKKASIEEFEKLADPLQDCQGFIGNKGVLDDARADGSPDKLVEQWDDVTTKKQLPTPWRSQTTQTKTSN
jgi:hypothetical protein